jgi:hypothetical protein
MYAWLGKPPAMFAQGGIERFDIAAHFLQALSALDRHLQGEEFGEALGLRRFVSQ